MFLVAGTVLRTTEGRPLMTVTGTTCERHDTIGGACSKESNTLRYGHHTYGQHACVENFVHEPCRHGLGKRDIQSNVNWFMNVPVEADGTLGIVDGISAPGLWVDLRAELDTLVVISQLPAGEQPLQRLRPDPGADHRHRARRVSAAAQSFSVVAAAVDPHHVWISRHDDAVVDAAVAAATGPLAGVTVAVKDSIDVAGLPTTAACPSFAYEPTATAPAVQRLLDAGAVVVGKTNLDQFATGLVGTRSPYGAVESPAAPGYVSGGSSSGSAAAVARGWADVGVATDTAGSGRVPAAFCGIVGLKGTRGWVPTTGVVPACPSFDCTTVLARTVTEAAGALRTMAGPDPDDPSGRTRPIDAVSAVRRIGTPAPHVLDGCDDRTRQRFRSALALVEEHGFELVEVDLDAYLEAGSLLYGGAFVAERTAAFGHHLGADADPAVAEIVGRGARWSAVDLAADRARLDALRLDAARVWSSVDAVLLPTTPCHPTIAEVEADPLGVNARLGRFVSGCNLVDWCAAAVPMPTDDGLPFGVQLLGPAWSDAAIWAVAARLLGEDAAGVATVDEPSGAHAAVAVAGAHLEGEPLNHQLTDRGATLERRTTTAPRYRMVALRETCPSPDWSTSARAAAPSRSRCGRCLPRGSGGSWPRSLHPSPSAACSWWTAPPCPASSAMRSSPRTPRTSPAGAAGGRGGPTHDLAGSRRCRRGAGRRHVHDGAGRPRPAGLLDGGRAAERGDGRPVAAPRQPDRRQRCGCGRARVHGGRAHPSLHRRSHGVPRRC